MLKKIVCLILLTCLIFSSQLVKAQFSRVGIRAGISSTSWIGDHVSADNVQYNSKIGGLIGIYSVREIGTNWSLEYGLNISLKGFDLSGQLLVPGVILGAQLKNHAVYIDIPVGVRYYPGRASPSGIFLLAGVSLSYLVYNKIEGTVVYNGSNFYGDPESNASELNRFDIGLFPGVGYQLNNGLNFQLIYEIGLLNTVKDVDYLGWTNAYNQAFKLVIGFDL